MSIKQQTSFFVRTSALGIFYLLFSEQTLPEQISCHLSIEKDTFLLGEKVMFELEIANAGVGTYDVYYPLLQNQEIFRLEVFDAAGKSYRYKGFRLTEGRPEKRTLRVGDVLQVQNSITDWYGDRDSLNQFFGIFRPGKYSVRAIYRPFKGVDSITSNKVWFTVISPNGDELKAFAVWSQIFYIIPGTEYGKQIEVLKRLVDGYETSAYRPGAFQHLIFAYVMSGDMVNAKRYLSKLLNDYPNSVFAWEGVLSCAWKMNQEERIALYEELGRQYKGTKIANTLLRNIRQVRSWQR